VLAEGGKNFAVGRLWTFCGRKFCGFRQKTQKLQNFLPQTLSSLKISVDIELFRENTT